MLTFNDTNLLPEKNLSVQSDTVVVNSERKKKFFKRLSAPKLTLKSNIKWLPLETFLVADNSEVPRISIWKPFGKEHIKDLWSLKERDSLAYLEDQIIPSEFSKLNKYFTKFLLYDVLAWCKKSGLSEKKTSSLLGIFYNTHKYYLGSMWRNQKEVYYFFKESILLHTIQDPPKSAEILRPEDCRSCLFYFLNTYLPVLPLIRVQLQPNYRLKLEWTPRNQRKSVSANKP